ncbi:MarR family winged helix-turn-helix transcriptional regulator [Sphingomonas soli]|uniref:MarR family winged helix-turn-helix transcriptional regulator n=1 Tax=Sphingomonas soli TaxID=266127 RepID=UPI00082FEB96|nr:MarR family transcriptional regulator [Sphingomonas soli]
MARNALSFGALSSLVGYRLRRASGAFALDFHDAMKGTGMRQVLVGILAIVEANPRVNQGAVGVALGIKRANMVSLINELVDAGLVEREVSADDRRAFSLTLTGAGETMRKNCIARIQEHEDRMLAALDAEERATLLRLLGRIEAKA